MPRRTKNLWNETNTQDLKKAVRRFNSKISRLEKKVAQLQRLEASKIVLPEKISVKEMKRIITTKADLKREIKAIDRFTKPKTRKGSKAKPQDFVDVPDNTNGLKITRWQKTEMNRNASQITKRRRTRKEKMLEFEQKDRGKPLGYTPQMGKAELLMLEPRKAFTPSMDASSIKARFKSLFKERQSSYYDLADNKFKENYINAIRAYYEHYPDVEKIVAVIMEMDIAEFIKKVTEETSISFEVASPKNGAVIDLDEYYNGLLSGWLPHKRKGA